MDGPNAASLDGRSFAPAGDGHEGEVGAGTVFHYREQGDLVWASYSGGRIRLGYLVGTRDGDRLSFRYVQVNVEDETASGECNSRIEWLDDGRIRMRESWRWESKEGSGTSIVEEVPG